MGFFTIANMLFYGLGLVSPDAMEAYANAMNPVWLLYPLYFLAILVHIALGLWKLYRRNTLSMPLWEATQIVFGLALPFVFLPHLYVTQAMGYFLPFRENYVDKVLLTFPSVAWRYVAVALIIGVHAHIGAHVVLRMRPWYPKVRAWIFLAFLIIPVAAAAGYWVGGSELYQSFTAGRLAADDMPHLLSATLQSSVQVFDYATYGFFLGLYALIFGARAVRIVAQKGRRTVRVHYPDGREVAVVPGTTILEASRLGRIAHASICGGRGRCTTCRVRVEATEGSVSPVGDRESKALARIDAAPDVRLACQTEGLSGVVKVTPLLPPDVRPGLARAETPDTVGRDLDLAVLFADLRGFTKLSEGRFPYDVVYILNRYFRDMGEAIEKHGGHIDKFLGDGILAYFGRKGEPRDACRQALEACVEMAKNLQAGNAQLATVLDEPLSLGLGLHFGSVILGEMGFGANKAVTIIGDTVNTASRLEQLNKVAKSQLVLSTVAGAQAGLDLSFLPMAHASVRGKTEKLRVYVVKDVLAELGPLIVPG